MSKSSIETILLVEDNPGDARLLLEMLKDRGLSGTVLIHVQSMNEAEKSLSENAVDIILLDLGLPDAYGLEAVRRVRAMAPRIPLVVLTGLDDEALASQALQQGAQDYLIKGQTEARGLLRALRYSIERKSMEEALFAEKERAQVTLNCIGDAVACTDLSGNLTFLNRAGENLTGWSWREAAGRPIAEVFRVLDASNHKAITYSMAAALRSDRVTTPSPDSVLIRRNGIEIPIEDSVAPIHDRDGLATGAVIVLRDVTTSRVMALRMAEAAADLAKQNSLLNKVNAELAAIVRSSPIAVFATDPAGVVTMWSPAAERLSGFSNRHAIGLFLPIVPEDVVEEFRNRIRRVSEGEQISNVELMAQKKDGTIIELSISMGPLIDESGVARGAISLAVNVTEAVTERKKIARMQSDFVSTVSHELRTPLTSIGGSLGLIAGGAVGVINERATRLVGIAHSNAQRLIRLVNDILDIEKLQSGQMAFRFEEVNLDEIVEQVISANLAYAATLGIEIRRVGTILNVAIKADADRVNQVITNLLSNAAKFSPVGACVEISVVRSDRTVRVTVSDSGPGIPLEFRARIFGRFAQADTSDMRTKGGSGLGLSIARKIMDHHGGTVSFDSELGVSTSFHLDFQALPATGMGSEEAGSGFKQSRAILYPEFESDEFARHLPGPSSLPTRAGAIVSGINRAAV